LPDFKMKRIHLLLPLLLLSACSTLGLSRSETPERIVLWNQAHQSLHSGEFAQAAAQFERVAREHPDSDAGRESLFYLATIRLDPRNPEWDPAPAEEHLRLYLAADSAQPGIVQRFPEARTLFQLARQLNMPADERVPGLQPETRVVTQRVVVPARESRALAAEVDRLRRQLAERDATIQQQKEELERIRKTLTGKR
jgi:hypothetical protein